MKRIVSGLLYDSEKAELIHKQELPLRTNKLYRTKKGAYFVVSAFLLENNLYPLENTEQVIHWLEEHGGEDVLLERFAEHVTEA